MEGSAPCPIPGLTPGVLHMRVKEGSKIRSLLRFVSTRLQEKAGDSGGPSLRQVVFTGSGRALTKTITCVEILKRRVSGLHQVTKLHYRAVNKSHGAAVEQPAICILLSKDPLDPHQPGYQPPQATGSEEAESHNASSSRHPLKRLCMDHQAEHPPKTFSE